MKKRLKKGKIVKLILILMILGYVLYTFANQQRTLNSYKSEQLYVTGQIKEQNEYKEELTSLKENVNSNDYIEEIAREKLDMYLPNERVYIDIGK